jgi:hypothetical protein
LSVEAYLVRLIAALARQNGGELRVKGELVDMIGESTTLTKYWDSANQEVVIRASLGMFTEIFRVVPEKQIPKPQTTPQVVDPVARQFAEQPAPEFTPHGTTLDDPRLGELERKREVRKAANLIREELQRNAKARAAAQERIPL